MTDAGIASDELVRKIGRAVEGGVDLVQLRDKTLPGGRLLDLARSIVQVIDGRAKLVVNERADVALISAAQGVQLGEGALPVAAAREILGDGLLIGRSVPSTALAVQDETESGTSCRPPRNQLRLTLPGLLAPWNVPTCL